MSVDSDRDARVLSLLRYARARRGVSENAYFIGQEGQEKTQYDKLCLLKMKAGSWVVLFIERGNVSQRVEHPSIRDGIQDLFWKLYRKDTPWDFREDWEAETGQSL
ncbi:hypothetical protein [Acidiphilium sp. MT5]